jgi:hypothetical protein
VTSIPEPLARRIDRLARRAHAFHRFAHHPLCTAYDGELIHLGPRTRLCRGCAMTAAGSLLGLALGVCAGLHANERVGTALLGGFFVAWGGALTIRVMHRRPSKVLTRALPAFLGVAAIGHAACCGVSTFLLVLTGNVVALSIFIILYRQKGPDRSPCHTCPERHQATPCSGLMPIVRRERAFRRVSRAWMSRAGI